MGMEIEGIKIDLLKFTRYLNGTYKAKYRLGVLII